MTVSQNQVTYLPSNSQPVASNPKPKKATRISRGNTATEVPIFLRKTYHMIDTCNPEISSWSEDGETFVVKQPEVFEKEIIPQFFKHSKFSSFVRQLNFYGFRKIKFTDTIKIDEKLEAETANFWRFRHEKFLRGRPDLLTEIRRSNSQSNVDKTKQTEKQPESQGDYSSLKSEVDSLKERISTMSVNLDQITSLMRDAKLKDDYNSVNTNETGAKRKKLDSVQSSLSMDIKMEDLGNPSADSMMPPIVPLSKTGENEPISFNPSVIFPLETNERQSSFNTNSTDDSFVDELLNAFGDDDSDYILPDQVSSVDMPLTPVQKPSMIPKVEDSPADSNAPDPALMNKLSDALTLLPKVTQEMLVNRLISTITSSDALKSHIDAAVSDATVVEKEKTKGNNALLRKNPEIALPLAAATLSALMAQYSNSKGKPCMQTKTIPAIPIHA
eukprot:CAMPEP_0184856884 /NCGR_PEP_ID=MMETSP0580-20130426/2049_1 /TAXON_ID=1118495 /ORGANISM="Dactyliosolen fragilissimus" /LENGTH=443 /DNA_ID=CAMNT_0027352147 /DNA_START=45 /DNA_END=1376 /DNA_ORIENTATION=-